MKYRIPAKLKEEIAKPLPVLKLIRWKIPVIHRAHGAAARIFKCLWGHAIDSKEWIPPAYVAWARICKPFKEPRNRFPAWRAGTTTLFFVPDRQAT